jgi:hypothetical protein
VPMSWIDIGVPPPLDIVPHPPIYPHSRMFPVFASKTSPPSLAVRVDDDAGEGPEKSNTKGPRRMT